MAETLDFEITFTGRRTRVRIRYVIIRLESRWIQESMFFIVFYIALKRMLESSILPIKYTFIFLFFCFPYTE